MFRFTVVSVLLAASSVHAEEAEPAHQQEAWEFHPGAFIQPQFRVRENSAAAVDENGFRFARARLTGRAVGTAGNLELSAYMEAELQPTFSMIDAWATVTRTLPSKGLLSLDVGQMRVQISRQQLLSDSKLSFVDRGALGTLTPDRDLGAKLSFIPPGVPVRVILGAYNGEGKNQIQNINEDYLYAARVEVTPFGGPIQPYSESSFDGNWLSGGASFGYNKLTPGEYRENRLYAGGDLSGSYRGISGTAEVLYVRYRFTGDEMRLPGPDYQALSWLAQVAYLLPVELPPYQQSRIEVAARVEEIDRNDTVPIPQLGDPAQSVRAYTGSVSAYLREHSLKAQLQFSHFTEVETETSTGSDATYANDQILLQVTYRVE